MKGIDIIEAMENIDERLILDAKRHKKVAPPWLRFISLAALFCCALLLGLLSINRIISPGEENVPDTLAPTEESAWGESSWKDNPQTEASAGEEFAAQEDYYFSSDTPLKCELPAGLTEETCIEFSEDGKTMTLFDPVSRDITDYDGKIWWIEIMTYEEFSSLAEMPYEELTVGWYGYTDRRYYILATDQNDYYVLNIPSDVQYDPNNKESSQSYRNYMQAGLSILSSVVSCNDLELNPIWGPAAEQKLFPELYRDTDSTPSEFQYTMSSFSTSHNNGEQYKTNLTLACDAINGTILQPGEAFSFNDVVGERTAEKGYLEASDSMIDGTLVFGGGISQVSSALYTCCLLADLEVIERQGHIYLDSVAAEGMDATVYWESVDFRFKNSYDYPIYIEAHQRGYIVDISIKTTSAPDYYGELKAKRNDLEDGSVAYLLTRYIYDLSGKLLRTDTTEDLDALGGLGTTVYALWDNSTEEDAEDEPAAEVEGYSIVTSNKSDAKLYVPAEYQNEIETDAQFTFTSHESGETFTFPNSVFYFYDYSQQEYGREGLVWMISLYSIDSLDTILENDALWGEFPFQVSNHVLGINEDSIYVLTCIETGYSTSQQYDSENQNNILSYYKHMAAGIEILETFVAENHLKIPDGVVAWKEWYTKNILTPVQEQLETNG